MLAPRQIAAQVETFTERFDEFGLVEARAVLDRLDVAVQ
jgi:hypothetical protein